MPLRTLKRRAASGRGAKAKKARLEQDPEESSDGSVYEGSDSSTYSEDQISEKEASEEEENDGPPRDCPTPQTSLSSKASSRFPSNRKTIHCTYADCDKMFNRQAKLTQHLRSHTNTRPFVCPRSPCTKDFLRESHLKHHIKSAHSDVREYVCPREGCGKSFVTGTRLRRHNAVHEGQDKFRCQVEGCGQSFRKHGTLHRHVAVVHEGKKPYVCQLLDEEGESCGAGFQSAGMLKAHEGRVHGSTRFYCVECSPEGQENDATSDQDAEQMGFPTYAALQAHIGSEHPPTCLECGLRCASNRELKIHVEVQHGALDVNERRTHACPETGCGRAFTKKGNLTIHIQTAHGGKRFVCGGIDLSALHKIGEWDGSDACGRAFTSKLSLEEHVRTAHLGLDHARKKASKGTDSSQTKGTSSLLWLTGSGYEHESGRDIACLLAYCSYRFMREIDLQSHLELHHGMARLTIPELRRARERLVNQPNLIGSSASAATQELEAEVALDMEFGHADGMEDIQETLHGEPSDLNLNSGMSQSGENGLAGEMEGGRMSGEEQVQGAREGHEIGMIDPSLH